jgi:hypothetical protein
VNEQDGNLGMLQDLGWDAAGSTTSMSTSSAPRHCASAAAGRSGAWLREFLEVNWRYLNSIAAVGRQFLKLVSYYDMLAYRWQLPSSGADPLQPGKR